MLAGQGETKQASISDFKIDKVGPTMTTVSFKKADNTAYTPGTWSTQNLVQTLSGNDNGGSGVSYFQYSENGGNPVTTNNGASWSSDRDKNVAFRAVDAVGNAGAWTSEYNLKIDKTGPTMTAVSGNFGSWVHSNSIGLAATDNLSGVASYQYYTSTGGAWYASPNPISCSQGAYTIYFRAIDVAGNIGSQVGPYSVYVDWTGPVCSAVQVLSRSTLSSGLIRSKIKFTFSDARMSEL